jgi:hypothetical protein
MEGLGGRSGELLESHAGELLALFPEALLRVPVL